MKRTRLFEVARILTIVTTIVGAAAAPDLLGPLLGVGFAAAFAGRPSRAGAVAVLGGLCAVAGWLPSPEVAVERLATALLFTSALVASMGWRHARAARTDCETAVDTVMMAASAKLGDGAAAPEQLTRMLVDVLGGTRGTLLPVEAVTAAAREAGKPAAARWTKSHGEIDIPLVDRGRVTGWARVGGLQRRPSSWRIDLAELVTRRWAVATHAAALDLSLLERDAVDPVTGLGNEQAVMAALSRIDEGDAILVVSLRDVEDIRSSHGDDRADLLLCQLGLHLRNRIRHTDLVARHGDDRFIVVCRDPKDATDSILDRLLDAWPVWDLGCRLVAGTAIHRAGRAALSTLDEALQPVIDLDAVEVRSLEAVIDARR